MRIEIHIQEETTVVVDPSPNSQLREDAILRRINRTRMINQAQEWQAIFLEESEDVFIQNTSPRLDTRRHAILFDSFHDTDVSITDENLVCEDTGQKEGQETQNIANNSINSIEKFGTTAKKSSQPSTVCDREYESFDPSGFKLLDLPLDLEEGIGFNPEDFEAYSKFEEDAKTQGSKDWSQV